MREPQVMGKYLDVRALLESEFCERWDNINKITRGESLEEENEVRDFSCF